MKIISLSLLLASGFWLLTSSRAADQFESVITITNTPALGETITINTDARTWTTNASPTTAQIAISTNGVSANATNLFRALAANMPTGTIYIAYSSTNAVKLFAQAGQALAASISNAYATVTDSTNTVSTAYSLRLPLTAEPSAAHRTNMADYIVSGLNTFGSSALTAARLPSSYSALSITSGTITTGIVSMATITNLTAVTANITTGTVGVLIISGTNYTVGIVNAIDELGNTNQVIRLTP